MDLTLRDGVDFQSALHTIREIGQQSKQAGSNQNALDQIARQGYSNALFELDLENESYLFEAISDAEVMQKVDN